MEVLTIAVTGIMCLFSFVVGAKVGQKAAKGETVELPELNPIKAYKRNEAQKKADIEQEKLNTVLQNIERYDGTSRGQKEVK